MAAKKGLPLWLAITLFLLLAALMAFAMILEMSDARKSMPVEKAVPKMHIELDFGLKMSIAKPKLVHQKVQPEAAVVAVEKASQALVKAKKRVPVVAPVLPAVGVALILDDVGFDLAALKRVLKLHIPVAIAIIPDAPYAHRAAVIAKNAGQVVMLHLPMQPQSEKYRRSMSSAFLTDEMSESQLRATFLKDLAMVPYVEGTNNHMGSSLTQMEKPMHWVMQLCKEKGLFFVDSRTSSKTVAGRIAKEMGLQHASRQIFLDDSVAPEALRASWQKARACAAKGGHCIVIGHPHRETVQFLERQLSVADRAMIVPLKRLLKPGVSAE
ncbi:MAG: divergent polysaccharide deacetylase family protein [Mariprofundus sp.]|nr:divergent polysaccharide deacetylase family protein [Mariprofundus sp.]